MTNNILLKQQALTVMEVIEDAVESICDEHLISGEKVWVMIEGLAEAKLQQFPVYEED
tara:strand:+ start:492 stop:665 length:174 start_codon:yes stop_codon:yes gene_type:complete